MIPARLPCSWAVANKHSGYKPKTAHVEVSNISGHEYPVELPQIDNMCGRGIIALTCEVVRDKATPVTTPRAQEALPQIKQICWDPLRGDPASQKLCEEKEP